MATYTIREVAQRFHVQTSTLRYYEDQGLLCDVERDDAGRRVYTDSHIGRLEAIACFKHAGMSIDELKTLLRIRKKTSVRTLRTCWNCWNRGIKRF